MPNPKPGEDKQAYVSRFMASAEAQKDFPDEKQRAAVAYSKFGELRNAVPLCSECGSEAIESDGRLTCPHCGLIDRHPTKAVESIPNMCRNPECSHPMTGEHDAMGCRVPGCLCTETRQAIAAPEDALNNGSATCNECKRPMTADGKGGWTGHAPGCSTGEKTNAEPRAAFEAHTQECEGCMNAYNSGKPETMCATGHAAMNSGGADKQRVLEEIKKLEKEIADFRAAPKTPENDRALQVKETTLAGLRRELSNEDKFAKGGDEFGKPGGTVTLVNGAERQNSMHPEEAAALAAYRGRS